MSRSAKPGRGLEVVDPGGLGDLEGAAGRVGVAFVEPALDVLEHRDVGQRGAGEVDVEGDRLARPLALAEQVPSAWPTTQRSSSWIIPERSATLDEGRGGQQLAVVAGIRSSSS